MRIPKTHSGIHANSVDPEKQRDLFVTGVFKGQSDDTYSGRHLVAISSQEVWHETAIISTM